jgi:prepilin-type N-terminal cleavage/methylation domain-containing protein
MNSPVPFDRSRAPRGHTLIELVMVLAVSGTIAGVVAPPLLEVTRARQRAIRRSVLLLEARTALERISRELREIPSRSGDSQAPDIASAAVSSIAYQAASLRVSGSLLERLEAGGSTWRTLAAHLSAFELTYFNGDGTPLTSLPLGAADLAAVRRIGIRLVLQDGAETVSLKTGAFLRYFAFRS